MSGPWEKFQQPSTEPAGPWQQYGAAPKETETQAAIRKVKEQGWGTGFPQFAYDLGGRVTDLAAGNVPPAVAGGLGFATNVLTQAIPSFLSSVSKVDVPKQSLMNWGKASLPKWLMQTAVKPSTDDLLSGNANQAVGTMLDEGIVPSMSGWGQHGMNDVARMTSKLDDQVGQRIAASTAQVPVGSVASRLDDTLTTAQMQVNPKTDMAAVENAWTEFLTSPHIAGKKEIPVQLAHELKKGTYKSLGGKSYGEVGSTSVEAQKALARGLREETMKAVPEIEPLLARQASLMNVRDVAGTRALLEANKNPMGLAALRVDHPLSSVSFLADRWAWLKALAAIGMHQGAYPQTIAPLGIAGAMGANQPALTDSTLKR
jgi:hypothetical protein